MLTMWRRLMTVKLLALSAAGLAVIVAFVAIGFWHRRQLQPIRKAMRSTHTKHLGHDASRSRCEASVQSRTPSEVKPLLPPWRVRWWSGHGLINEDSAPGLRGLP